jgi:hypothetical protein
MTILTFHATLQRAPYPEEIQRTGLLPPQIATETDFAAYRAFAKAEWAPVLLNFQQKYRFMEGILAAIRNHLGGDFDLILMTCRVPGVLRFPTAFNADDIFKVAALEPEACRLRARGLRLLTLHEGFVRHPMEVGGNELAMTLDAPTDAAAVRFAALCEEITASGLWAQRGVA